MPRSDPSRKHCAIYTRKSSEEGLEQEFNSLQAQSEACEAYIRSQRHEGWILARTHYDDGGFSGGNIPLGYDASERTLVINPAEAETVRCIFALYREFGCVRGVKEEADRLGLRTKGSTTANGTERGGKPFSRGHIYRLLSNPIYTGHIAHKGELYSGQHPTLIDAETWNAVRGQLAVNRNRNRSKSHAAEPSLLAGLVTDAWGKRLTPSHAVKKGRRYRYYVSAALITKSGEDRAPGWRLAATEVEDAVIRILLDALTNPALLLDRLGTAGTPGEQVRKLLGRAARFAVALKGSPAKRAKVVRELVEKVMVADDKITIRMRRAPLLGGDVPSSASDIPTDAATELTAAAGLRRRGLETKLVLPGLAQQNHSDPALIKAIARGRAWFEELATGRARTLQELSRRDGISRRYIRRLVNLAFLSPKLIEAILQGGQPVELTATRLTALDLPLDWTEQHRLLVG